MKSFLLRFSLLVILSIVTFSMLGFYSTKANAMALPTQPTAADDPGSSYYPFAISRISLNFNGAHGALYVPQVKSNAPLTLIAFAHGHLVPEIGYTAMYEHLAKKGIALLYIPYDEGANDIHAMAKVYQYWVESTVAAYPEHFDASRVIYSGHSKGALVATMAAGLSSQGKVVPRSVVVYGVAGSSYQEQTLIPKQTIVNLVVGDADTNTPPQITVEAFQNIPVTKKQMIQLSSYRGFDHDMIADHGSCRTLGFEGSQVGPLHWFAYWRFLVAAAWDVDAGAPGTNPWIYGQGAYTTGAPTIMNKVVRSTNVL